MLKAVSLSAQNVSFSWNADAPTLDPNTNAVGYNVHIGTSSGNYTITSNAANVPHLTLSNLLAGQKYFAVVKAYNAAGTESLASNEVNFVAGSATMTIGAATVYTAVDSGNAGLILAQRADLNRKSTLKSISFYVTTASGTLQLAIYSGASKPTTLIASTPLFNATVGWNTKDLTPVILAAGTYWLVYLPSSNNLAFRVTRTYGTTFYTTAYTAPKSFPSATKTGCQWSFYATLIPS